VKIKPVDSTIIGGSKLSTSRGADSMAGSFEMALKDSVNEQKTQICSELLQKIDVQSRELKKRPTPEGIKRYVELVRSFMKEAIGQAYSLEEETLWDRFGNRKNFVIVKRINASLEELIDSVVSQEKNQLDLVGKLDEIRGLLIDLYW